MNKENNAKASSLFEKHVGIFVYICGNPLSMFHSFLRYTFQWDPNSQGRNLAGSDSNYAGRHQSIDSSEMLGPSLKTLASKREYLPLGKH